MITIREATGTDAPGIRDVFAASYGMDYPYPQYYDVQLLTKLIYSDDTLLLAAVDTETNRVLGTASVILQVGAFGDLVGEFGRLAVHPDARHRGVGSMLMEERLQRVQNQLHVGLIEGRVAHPYTLKIAQRQQFAVIGFLPQKMLLRQRESLALLVRYFDSALALRNNNPRVIPEAYPLAQLALEACALPIDAIVDEESAPYPYNSGFAIQELTADGYATLLRIERGRVRNREIFGPMRLHYGFFKLQRASRTTCWPARRDVSPVLWDSCWIRFEKAVRVFELITLHDDVIRFLLNELERYCREEGGMAYIEVDVSAYAPRMQRTLLELNFLPAAYVPALVFHDVERLDVIKMVRLLSPLEPETVMLSPEAQAVADVVLRGFRSRSILPRIAQAVGELPLFAGLNPEQVNRLAGVCGLERFGPQETIFAQGSIAKTMYILLNGEASVVLDGEAVARVTGGECLGEMAVVTDSVHSATAITQTAVEAAVLSHAELTELIRRRPDIGLILYKNVAAGMAHKLRRSDRSLASGLSDSAR